MYYTYVVVFVALDTDKNILNAVPTSIKVEAC